METGLARAFRGDFDTVDLPTLEASADGERHTAVNDVVVRSADVGRMVELAWSISGEDLGTTAGGRDDRLHPVGSTAYNLSNGGPVLVWGLEAMAITFVAAHSLHARPLVVPKDARLGIVNETPDVSVVVLVDGHAVGELPPGGDVAIRIGDERACLAVLVRALVLPRYRETFAS